MNHGIKETIPASERSPIRHEKSFPNEDMDFVSKIKVPAGQPPSATPGFEKQDIDAIQENALSGISRPDIGTEKLFPPVRKRAARF